MADELVQDGKDNGKYGDDVRAIRHFGAGVGALAEQMEEAAFTAGGVAQKQAQGYAALFRVHGQYARFIGDEHFPNVSAGDEAIRHTAGLLLLLADSMDRGLNDTQCYSIAHALNLTLPGIEALAAHMGSTPPRVGDLPTTGQTV